MDVSPKQKIYCYVDETGQDTEGDLFIVAVVLTGTERQALTEFLERLEQETRKDRAKWTVAKDSFRLAYMNRVLPPEYFPENSTTAFITTRGITPPEPS